MKSNKWIFLAAILAAFQCAGAQTLVTERTL